LNRHASSRLQVTEASHRGDHPSIVADFAARSFLDAARLLILAGCRRAMSGLRKTLPQPARTRVRPACSGQPDGNTVDSALQGGNHTMRVIVPLRAIALGLAVTVAGCASPPNADVDAAKAAIDKATTDRAAIRSCRRLAQGCPGCPGSPRRRAEGSGKQVGQVVRQDKELAIAAKAQATRRRPMLSRARRRPMLSRSKRKPMPRPGRRPKRRPSASEVRSRHQSRSWTSSRCTGHGIVHACRRGGRHRSDDRT